MIVVKFTEDEADLQKIFSLRYEVYCGEKGYLAPEDYIQKKERDEYDDSAFHFAAFCGDDVIAALRLLKPLNGKFLMEESFSLPTEIDRDCLLEASRCMVAKSHRGSALFLYLLKCAYLFSVKKGYEYWCGTLTRSFAKATELAGWSPTYLGGFTKYHNSESIPFWIRLVPEKVFLPPDNEEIKIEAT